MGANGGKEATCMGWMAKAQLPRRPEDRYTGADDMDSDDEAGATLLNQGDEPWCVRCAVASAAEDAIDFITGGQVKIDPWAMVRKIVETTGADRACKPLTLDGWEGDVPTQQPPGSSVHVRLQIRQRHTAFRKDVEAGRNPPKDDCPAGYFVNFDSAAIWPWMQGKHAVYIVDVRRKLFGFGGTWIVGQNSWGAREKSPEIPINGADVKIYMVSVTLDRKTAPKVAGKGSGISAVATRRATVVKSPGTSRYNKSYYCRVDRVAEVGLDTWAVTFEVVGDMSLGPLQKPRASWISVGKDQRTPIDMKLEHEDYTRCIRGTLTYRLPPGCCEFGFTYGQGGYSSLKINLRQG